MKPGDVEACSCPRANRCGLETGNMRRRRPRGMECSDGHQRGRESSIARLGAVILLARTGSAFVCPSSTGTLSQSASPFLCSRSRAETIFHTLPRVALGLAVTDVDDPERETPRRHPQHRMEKSTGTATSSWSSASASPPTPLPPPFSSTSSTSANHPTRLLEAHTSMAFGGCSEEEQSQQRSRIEQSTGAEEKSEVGSGSRPAWTSTPEPVGGAGSVGGGSEGDVEDLRPGNAFVATLTETGEPSNAGVHDGGIQVLKGTRSPEKDKCRKSPRKRRSKENAHSWDKRALQNAVAAQLKADSASGTLRTFNEAMEKGISLPSNLLCGVLNQAAKAGQMDDCARVLDEMKRRSLVLEENMYVPLIRELVAQGDCDSAFNLLEDMVKQGVQPRLRCYEPLLARMCSEGDMEGARKAWEHMEANEVIPREDQYVNFLAGLGISGEFWHYGSSGKLDDIFYGMSYRARNITMDQAQQLQELVNTPPLALGLLPTSKPSPEEEDDARILSAMGEGPPLAQLVEVGVKADDRSNEDQDQEPQQLEALEEQEHEEEHEEEHEGEQMDWGKGWSDGPRKPPPSCPACGGKLKAVGLTPGERARIRDTLFGLAGLQVKKHSKSRWTRRMKHTKADDEAAVVDSRLYSFTEEDQIEQLQNFVEWLDDQRAKNNTFTTVIDSANVAYHRGNPWHFSLPQVDLMVQELERRGERPLVVVAEKYMDRVEDTSESKAVTNQRFRYMRTPVNKAIVKRWRAKCQVYECSDEASDDWYWMYGAVAFDDIPMTVISNDRTRDHRISLAEPVPFLRWRTTQLARFDIMNAGIHTLKENKRTNGQGQVLSLKPPVVEIEAPPAFTRDVQQSDEGCWHLPVGDGNEWLCLDIPRGLKMGLGRLPIRQRGTREHKHQREDRHEDQQTVAVEVPPDPAPSQPGPDANADGTDVSRDLAALSGESATAIGDDSGSGVNELEAKVRKVGGILQSMPAKQRHGRMPIQGAVQVAAAARDAAAAAAARDAVAAATANVVMQGARNEGACWEPTNGDGVSSDRRAMSPSSSSSPQSASSTRFEQSREERAEPEPSARDSGAIGKPAHGVYRDVMGRALGQGFLGTTAVDDDDVLRGRPGEEEGMEGEDELASSAARLHKGMHSYVDSELESGDDHAGDARRGGGDDDDEEEVEVEVDWGSMTVVALRDVLRARGLKVSGNKADLVERLSAR